MNITLKIFSYRFYVREFLLLFFAFFLTEGIFSWIFIRNSIIIEGYQKLLVLFAYGFMLYKFNSLKKGEKLIVAVFTLLMIKLVLESLAKYDSVFKQLTMFTVLAPVIYIVFIKFILRSLQVDLLEFMAKFYLITYIVFMILFGRGFSFSLDQVDMYDYGPFSGDTRVIHASHIFMMIIPLLWYLHRFIATKEFKFLLVFLFCFGILLIHQHRSVWSSGLAALFIYFFISLRNRLQKLPAVVNLFLMAGVMLMLSYFFVANLFPGFLDFLSDRFSEIFDPSKEGSTGNFRIQQREVYFNLYLQRPIFGWTFEGFEMPNPLVDWWPPMTGQHFHEGYMEMLFYHGIVGLLFKYGFLIYLVIKAFSRKLRDDSTILIAFCISALIFSLNYVLPLVFWGFVGMAMYHIEKDQAEYDEDGEALDSENHFTPYTIS